MVTFLLIGNYNLKVVISYKIKKYILPIFPEECILHIFYVFIKKCLQRIEVYAIIINVERNYILPFYPIHSNTKTAPSAKMRFLCVLYMLDIFTVFVYTCYQSLNKCI